MIFLENIKDYTHAHRHTHKPVRIQLQDTKSTYKNTLTTNYHVSHLSCVWLFATQWTIVHQAPLSMKFSRQEYWSVLPCPPAGDLPHPGIEPVSFMSPALAGEFLTTSATLRKGNKKTILYMIASKRTKYLGINLAKETKDFCTEYCKILLKEIKDINK